MGEPRCVTHFSRLGGSWAWRREKVEKDEKERERAIVNGVMIITNRIALQESIEGSQNIRVE